MKKMLLALLALGTLCCGQDREEEVCPAVAAAGLSVNVTNAATAQPLCDASVTATDGGYSERLVPTPCTHVGAFERPGTYVVRVERAGFVAREVGQVQVVMGGGRCPHVQEVRLAIPLTPES